MNNSVTGQFVLLAINQNKYPNILIDYDLLGGTFSLGLYELVKHEVLEILPDEKQRDDIKLSVKRNLPVELKHLSQLYEAVKFSEKKTISDIIYTFSFTISSHYYNQCLDDITLYLTEQGELQQDTKKGFFNREKVVLNVTDEKVKMIVEGIRHNITAEASDIDRVVLAKVLQKTGLLNIYFSKEENKTLKQEIDNVLTNSSEPIVRATLEVMDDILGIILAVITSTVL